MLCVTVARGDDAGHGPVGWWPFDEGAGVYSAHAVDPVGEAELHNVLWVKGEFGNALRFTDTDSFVALPSIAKLDGSDELSIAI